MRKGKKKLNDSSNKLAITKKNWLRDVMTSHTMTCLKCSVQKEQALYLKYNVFVQCMYKKDKYGMR